MKSVILNGVEVKIGSMVRLINDFDMYSTGEVSETIIRPILYGYYVVRGFSPISGSFYLDGINNKTYLLNYSGEMFEIEPAFAINRFVPVPNSKMSQSDAKKESKSNFTKITINREVIESLDLKEVLEFTN